MSETGSHNDAVNYDVAREILTLQIGFRSLWIGREERKPSPDQKQIARWLEEMKSFARERRILRVTDQEGVNRIRETYEPVVKELVAAERARDA